jgi:hypothetical protein
MSKGNDFTLIVNDSKQDKLLMATDSLSNRIAEIRLQRLRQWITKQVCAKTTKIPTEVMGELAPLDSYSRLKSYAQRAQIVTAATPFPDYNSGELDPTLADIARTHVFFMYSQYKPYVALGYSYVKIGAQGNLNFASSTNTSDDAKLEFTLRQESTFINDCVLHLTLHGLAGLVNNIAECDRVKYAELLAHRVVRKVSFAVNNNPLDEYTSEDMNVFYNFCVPPAKRDGYKRCVGQEVPVVGYLTQEPRTDLIREKKQICDGPQTLKFTHTDVEIWMPLLFWFRDPKQALPSAPIPWGQTKVTVELANSDIFTAGVDQIAQAAITNYTRPTMTAAELYVKEIQTNPEISDLIIKRVAFSLIRVHRQHEKRLIGSSGDILLSSFKWPIETMYVGFRPVANLSNVDYWHRNSAITLNNVLVPVYTTLPGPPGIAIGTMQYESQTPTIDRLMLTAHGGNVLYPSIQREFYSRYMPFQHGNCCCGNTPEYDDWYMINFNLYPGEYQPSGHLNASQARELYLSYTSSYIDRTHPVVMYALGIALNFLVVSDASVVLRYST